MSAKELPTQAELKRIFEYDAEEGVLRNRLTRNPRARSGSKAGARSVDRNGYCYFVVGISGHKYKLHRVIWKLVYGNDPLDQIDHVNGDTLDNRLSNLRDVTHQQNLLNCHFHRNSNTARRQSARKRIFIGPPKPKRQRLFVYPEGIKGVRWTGKSWQSRYCDTYLGSFPDLFEAAARRKSFEAAL